MSGPLPDLFQGALNIGVRYLREGAYFAAYRNLRRAATLAPGEEIELARGLVHLAVAGYKLNRDDRRGFDRQLAHARSRLAPFLPSARRIELAVLLERVAERVELPTFRGGGGLQSGVDLDDSAALLDLMEEDDRPF